MIPPSEGNMNWEIDWDELEETFSNKTRIIILNSPHNPTGKIFTNEEQQRIAELVLKHKNCLVLSDEVY